MMKNIIDILFNIMLMLLGSMMLSLFLTVMCTAGVYFYDDLTFLIITFIVVMTLFIIFRIFV